MTKFIRQNGKLVNAKAVQQPLVIPDMPGALPGLYVCFAKIRLISSDGANLSARAIYRRDYMDTNFWVPKVNIRKADVLERDVWFHFVIRERPEHPMNPEFVYVLPPRDSNDLYHDTFRTGEVVSASTSGSFFHKTVKLKVRLHGDNSERDVEFSHLGAYDNDIAVVHHLRGNKVTAVLNEGRIIGISSWGHK